MPRRVAVLGGGAAGLMAAIRAAERGARVVLIERNRKPGAKILASGGGRCNLTTTREGAALLRAFPERQRRFLEPAFKALPPRRLCAWFEERGVGLHSEAMEKVFPDAGRASVVLDALLTAAAEAGVELACGRRVRDVTPEGDGFRVVCDTDEIEVDRAILAVGGKSYPKAGTVGDGYAIAARLGLPLERQYPGLVGLLATDPIIDGLAGITVEEATVRLADPETGRTEARWDRPVLFTHDGLSGPGAMNLAGLIASGGPRSVLVDLLPKTSFEDLDALLVAAAATKPCGVVALLPRALPERLRRAVVRAAEVDPATMSSTLGRDARRRLVHRVKTFKVGVTGTLGWDRAEVTVGGVALDAVDRKTMEAHGRARFHVCGEVLDVDGPIGGYNFQAAFATGWLAGEGAARA